jgi:quercetin dioxygenase-like cupin family protein
MTFQQAIVADLGGAPVAPPRRFLSFTARILGNGRDTGGLHAVQLDLPSGEGSPWHVHHEEDEWFYVIAGELEVLVGEERVRAGTGDLAFGPRDVPHGFRVTSSSPARVLLLTVGGRFSDFIAENSTAILDGVSAEAQAPDFEKLAASARRYGQEILGPLPD